MLKPIDERRSARRLHNAPEKTTELLKIPKGMARKEHPRKEGGGKGTQLRCSTCVPERRCDFCANWSAFCVVNFSAASVDIVAFSGNSVDFPVDG